MKKRVQCVTQVTPWGLMVIAASDQGLVGLRFSDQGLPATWQGVEANHSATARLQQAIEDTQEWLAHFASNPQVHPPRRPSLDDASATPFQRQVWQLMDRIPSGQTTSYARIAHHLGTSARAVGRAVGSNPWLILRPCHRVVGISGALTGYAGGLARKAALLQFEAQAH